MIFDAECSPARDPAELKPKLCEQFGICVCGAGGNGRSTLEFQRRFAALLRPYFTAPRKRKGQTLSAELIARRAHILSNKRMLTQGFLVARLSARQGGGMAEGLSAAAAQSSSWGRVAQRAAVSMLCDKDPASTEMWLHLGHLNFRNWFFAGLLLKKAGADPAPGAAGKQFIRLEVSAEAQFQWCIPFFQQLQFQLPCFLQLYQIVSNDDILTDRQMTPNWVLVSEFGATPELRVWKGEDEEAQDRAKKKSKSKSTSSKRQTGASSKAPAAKRRRTSDGGRPELQDGDQAGGGPEEQESEDDLLALLLGEEAEEEEKPGDGDDDEVLPTESEASVLCDADDEDEDDDGEDGPQEEAELEHRHDHAAASEVDVQPEPSSGASASSVPPERPSASSARRNVGSVDAAARAHASRRKMFKDVAVPFDNHGELRYNIMSESIVAICKVHGGACKRTRTVRPAAKDSLTNCGQGRPVGLLAAWLSQSHQHASSEAHRDAILYITSAARRAARRAFAAAPDASDILDMERDRTAGEGEEPDVIR